MACEAMLLAMPVEVILLRPIFRVAGQKDSLSFKIREELSRHPFLNEFFPIQENPGIIGQRPEAAIELPVRIF